MVDLSRLHKGISKTHKTFKTAMEHTIEGFCLITAHHRSGNTLYRKINNLWRQGSSFLGFTALNSEAEDEEKLKKQKDDWTDMGFSLEVSIYSALFTPALEKAITEGIFNQSAIQEAFDQDSNFKDPNDIPLWDKAHIFETRINDKQRQQAIKGIDRIIKDKSEGNLESVFKLFFRKLNLKTYGIGDMALGEIETCAKDYIDCVFKDTPYPEAFKQSGDFPYAWDSRFFSDQKENYPKGTHGAHMTNIIDHARELFCKKTLSELPSLMFGAIKKKDHLEFKRYAELTGLDGDNFNPFAHVDQGRFMETLYSAKADTQRIIMRVLTHSSVSAGTRQWVGGMIKKLSAHINKQGGHSNLQKINHARLRVWIETYNHKHPQTSNPADEP